MKLDENTRRLIAELEYLIGHECYNPNSYDGWNDIEGCSFRYPITVLFNKTDYVKIKGNIRDYSVYENLSDKTIKSMKYKFGSNELFIGRGIINILEYLEDKYNLDFCDMEQKLKNNQTTKD